MLGRSLLPLFISVCMCLGGNVASVHVHVYVWEGRINVTSDHVHVYALEGGVNVASVHVYMYIMLGDQYYLCSCPCVCIEGQCCRCSYQCVCGRGGSLLPMFMSMCMC